MKLENEFTVPASVDEAWALLLDVPRVAPCLPGATIEDGDSEDGTYNGTMQIKIGPITARYKGTVSIQETDESERRVAMRAQAKDARGQGTAAATITSTMSETGEGTRITVVTDMRVTGPAAQFGRGVMQDVSAKLMTRFAECLAQQLQGAPAPEAAAAAAPAESTNGASGEAVPSASSGVSSAEAEREAPSASSGQSTAEPKPVERPTPEVLDLGEAAGGAMVKRIAPVAGALLALIILIRLIRR